MAYDMPEPCIYPSLDSCQKRFMWTHKEVDLALHPVIGPGSCAPSKRFEEVSSDSSFQNPGSFFQSEQVRSMLHSHRGGWR